MFHFPDLFARHPGCSALLVLALGLGFGTPGARAGTVTFVQFQEADQPDNLKAKSNDTSTILLTTGQVTFNVQNGTNPFVDLPGGQAATISSAAATVQTVTNLGRTFFAADPASGVVLKGDALPALGFLVVVAGLWELGRHLRKGWVSVDR